MCLKQVTCYRSKRMVSVLVVLHVTSWSRFCISSCTLQPSKQALHLMPLAPYMAGVTPIADTCNRCVSATRIIDDNPPPYNRYAFPRNSQLQQRRLSSMFSRFQYSLPLRFNNDNENSLDLLWLFLAVAVEFPYLHDRDTSKPCCASSSPDREKMRVNV